MTTPSPSSPSSPSSRTARTGAVLFWCWNVLFVCTTLPLLPSLFEVVTEWSDDMMPLGYLLTWLAWMVGPWLFMAVALLRLKGRAQPVSLLFFAVEAPLYCLCVYRLLALREVTPAVGQWLALMAFGLCVHGVDMLVRPLPRTRLWQAVKLAATVCLTLVSVYLGTLVLLSLSPLVLRGGWELLSPSNWISAWEALLRSPSMFVFGPMFGLLCLVTFASLAVMPWCMVRLSWLSLRQIWRDGILSTPQRLGTVVAVLGLQVAAGLHLNHQPQRAVLAEMAAPSVTPELFQARKEAWREGLLNAYLARYRYVSTTAESKGIAMLYQRMLGFSPEASQVPQAVFNWLAVPLLYDGESMTDDSTEAVRLYERYFDTPIQRGERDTILRALSATYNRDDRESGLMNIDQRKVWVAEQRVRVQAQGDLASITLDETYQNLTPTEQEIFYLFSLPEGAALTGLWLGNAPDEMLPHTVSTRGAAQRVYKAEVQRRVDPALLEQVGPRQYRLRAYPVPPHFDRDRSWRPRSDGKLYLRMTYTTLARDGAWPLPVLAEKRNVAFDHRTRRDCDGRPCPGDGSTWWPRELPARQAVVPAAHTFRLKDGPWISATPTVDKPVAPQGLRVLLVVDRSASMAAHQAELRAALETARQQLAGNHVSVLLTSTSVMATPPRLVPLDQLDDSQLQVFMGGGQVNELLAQMEATVSQPADLTLVLTDQGAFDLDAERTRHPWKPGGGMLSFVHLGGVLAPAYDDATLEAVQRSGGSSFTTLPEAWAHFARAHSAGPGFLMQRDGYTYAVSRNEQAAREPDAAFAPVAARLQVAQATRQVKPLDLEVLDQLHGWAREHDVVTPYSSMLVLVNSAQRDALAKAESKDDRFERTPEQGTENLQAPNNPLSANAAPEPEEWLLMGVGLMALAWMVRVRRRGLAAQSAANPRNPITSGRYRG